MYNNKRIKYKLMWRNWQTHQTQNLAGNRVGSSPTISTKLGKQLLTK